MTWLIFGAIAPAAAVALIILWSGNYSVKVQWTLTILIVCCFIGFISSAREHLIRPLQTMTNLLAALREGDYSIRARGARENDALGEALLEVNCQWEEVGAFARCLTHSGSHEKYCVAVADEDCAVGQSGHFASFQA